MPIVCAFGWDFGGCCHLNARLGRYMYLKSLARITLSVGDFWSLILGMSGRSMVCEGMYKFIMRIGMGGLLYILKTTVVY